MILVDTHTHIYAEQFDDDRDDVILRAKEEGFSKILLPNIDCSTLSSLYDTVNRSTNICLPMLGLHPTSVKEDFKTELDTLKQELSKHSFCAIGEIGIDLYWDQTFLKEQQETFEEQLQWSIDYDLPVSIHTRNATKEMIDVLKSVGAHNLKGVFHSFVGDENELTELLKFDNFMFGINGVVTYKNSDLRQVLIKAPLERIVIETDAPYLTPVPFRGKRNEPARAIFIVKELANIFQQSEENIALVTSKNANRMFKLGLDL